MYLPTFTVSASDNAKAEKKQQKEKPRLLGQLLISCDTTTVGYSIIDSLYPNYRSSECSCYPKEHGSPKHIVVLGVGITVDSVVVAEVFP